MSDPKPPMGDGDNVVDDRVPPLLWGRFVAGLGGVGMAVLLPLWDPPPVVGCASCERLPDAEAEEDGSTGVVAHDCAAADDDCADRFVAPAVEGRARCRGSTSFDESRRAA